MNGGYARIKSNLIVIRLKKKHKPCTFYIKVNSSVVILAITWYSNFEFLIQFVL